MADWDFSPKSEAREHRAFTREDAAELLDYCPDTGSFRWKVRVMCFAGGRMPGDEAGTIKDGYRQIKLFGRFYRAHHLAWLLMTGEWPPVGIDLDHKNRNRADNRWSNLRLATRGQNNVNTSTRRESKSGHRGVGQRAGSRSRPVGRWFARIKVDHQVIHLGMFDSLDDAISARRSAELRYYGEYS